MSANFCLQPYHIGERLLACFLNQNKEIVQKKFKIKGKDAIIYFEEAIPEQSFSFENAKIHTDDQHKIDIALKSKDKFYAVELKLGPHNITKENKKRERSVFSRFFSKKKQCHIQQRKEEKYLNGNMCCLLSGIWTKPDKNKIPKWGIENPGDVSTNWFLIVRDESVKKIVPKNLKNCTILSLEEIIEGNENDFMNCIRECIVLPTVNDYLSKWGLAKTEK